MKVLSTEGLTKLIQLIKSTFIPASDTVSASTVTLADVATTGDYDDLINKPTIPAAQVNSDWDAVSGVAQILNKPTLATVATSGSYNDLTDKPTIPTVNDGTLTIQKNGTDVTTFTANSSTNATANITVPTTAAEVNALPDSTKYGADLDLTGGTLQLLDQDGNALGNSVTVPDTSDFVQKTGDTMTGALTIDAQTDNHLKLVHSDTTKGTNPATTEYTVIEFNDNTNDDDYTQTRLGDVHHTLKADGTSMMTISAYKNELGSSDNASIQISEDASGNKNAETNCPLTIKTNQRAMYLVGTGKTKGTTPATDQYTQIVFNDSANSTSTGTSRLGAVEHTLDTSGNSFIRIAATRNTAGSTNAATLELKETNGGVASCSFPNTTCADGQWVNSSSTLESQVSYATGTYSKNFDLSSYLPNDGKKYEVLVSAETSTGNSSGSYVYVRVKSDIITSDVTLLRAVTRTSSSATAGGSVIIPVGTGRKLVRSVQVGTSATGNSYLLVCGYRRIGTNS